MCHWKWQRPRFKTTSRLAHARVHIALPPRTGPPSPSEMPLGSGGGILLRSLPLQCEHRRPLPLLRASLSVVIAHILVLFCILFRAFLMALHPERHQRILRPPLCLEMQIKWLLLRGKGEKLMFYCFKLGSGYSVMYCVALNAFLCLIFH